MQVLPIVLQGAFVAGLFGLLAAVVSRSVAAQQLNVSRQTLFVALLPKRSEWRESFGSAVRERTNEISRDDPKVIARRAADAKITNLTTPLSRLQDLRTQAAFLFGEEVVSNVDGIIDSLAKLALIKNLEINNNPFVTKDPHGENFFEAQADVSRALRQLYEVLQPYLSVEDIKILQGAGRSRWRRSEPKKIENT